jgi:hypothetical protein
MTWLSCADVIFSIHRFRVWSRQSDSSPTPVTSSIYVADFRMFARTSNFFLLVYLQERTQQTFQLGINCETLRWVRRMPPSGMLRCEDLIRPDVSEAKFVPSSPILVALIMKAINSSQTSVLRRATRRNISVDGILHSHRREKLKSYMTGIDHSFS